MLRASGVREPVAAYLEAYCAHVCVLCVSMCALKYGVCRKRQQRLWRQQSRASVAST